MNRASRHLLGGLALLFLLASCGILPERPPSPALHDFGLTARSAPPGGEAAPWSSVAVSAPEWLQSENIRYRLLYAEPTRVRFYSQDRWIAPPPALLAQRLSQRDGNDGYGLKISLLAFEQVFDGPGQARLLVSFRASAYRQGFDVAISEKTFRFVRPTPSADAQGAVTAASGWVDEAEQSLDDWLRGLPAAR